MREQKKLNLTVEGKARLPLSLTHCPSFDYLNQKILLTLVRPFYILIMGDVEPKQTLPNQTPFSRGLNFASVGCV